MNDTLDDTDIILEHSRFWFQKVLVPILVCVGVAGNTITVMVLTRRRMRSSTNIYLSALAIADIIHLLFVLLLSFKHYNNIHDRKYELYWRFYGLSHWLCDAASSTSVWLTVSFTIERYIAVCHPIKGKFFCTENRAKTVTVIVYIFCLLTTASTAFEYQLTLECPKHCPKDNSTTTNLTLSNNSTYGNHLKPKSAMLNKERSYKNEDLFDVYNDAVLNQTLSSILDNCSKNHSHIIFVLNATNRRSLPPNSQVKNISNLTIVHQILDESALEKTPSELISENKSENLKHNNTETECCTQKLLDVEGTNLGKNKNYKSFIHWYSSVVFVIVPLVLIATFNCFLVWAVYTSKRTRSTMTRKNTQSSQSENSSVSNENRITIMLIAVVLMFLICQTPTAIHLIYYIFNPIVTKRQMHISQTLGNVFNTLVTLNPSCNFILYSIMSKKFRSTFKQLFTNRNKKARQENLQLSSMRSQNNSQKFNPYHHGISRNGSEYRTPRNLETTSLTTLPRSKSLMVRPVGKARSTDLVV